MSSDTSSLVDEISGQTEMVDVEANRTQPQIDVGASTVGYKVQNFKYKMFSNAKPTDTATTHQKFSSTNEGGKSAWFGSSSSGSGTGINQFFKGSLIRKYSLGRVIVLVVAAAIVLVVLAILFSQLRTIHTERWFRQQQCNDPQCLLMAGSLYAKINRSVSPCDDFYQYACGRHFKGFGRDHEPDSPSAQTANSFRSGFNPDVVVHFNREKSWRFLRIHRPAIDHLAEINIQAIIQALDNIVRRSDPNISQNSAKYKVATWYTSCTSRTIRDWLGSSELMHLAIPALGGAWLFDRTASNETSAGGENQTLNWPSVLFNGNGMPHQMVMASNWSWMNAVTQLQVVLHVPVFVDLSLRKGVDGKAQIVLKADPNAQPRSTFYGVDGYMNNLMRLFVHDGGIPYEDLEILNRLKIFTADVKLMMKLLQKIFGRTRSEATSLGHLYSGARLFDWKGFLTAYFSEAGIRFTDDYQVYSPNIEYLTRLPRLLEEMQQNYTTPVFHRMVNNYLVWNLMEAYAWHLSYEFSSVTNFHNGQTESSLEADCLIFAHELFGSVLGAIYLENHVNPERIEHVKKMVDYIKAGLTAQLRVIHWMDEETKERIAQRVQEMRVEYEVPARLQDEAELNYALRNLKVTSVYLSNLVAAIGHLRSLYNRALAGISELIEQDWLSRDVNVYDSKIGIRMDSLKVFVPAGVLQPPAYHHSLPPALNFAGLGSMLGTAMAHIIGEIGSFSNHGNLWSEHSWNEYMKHWDCEHELLENNTDLHLGDFNYLLSLIGTVVQKGTFDIINEASGLDIAQHALESWLRDNVNSEAHKYLPGELMPHLQLFYVAYAQTFCHKYDREESVHRMFGSKSHLPMDIKVNHILSEQPGFSEVFGCPKGSQMNKADHCLAVF